MESVQVNIMNNGDFTRLSKIDRQKLKDLLERNVIIHLALYPAIVFFIPKDAIEKYRDHSPSPFLCERLDKEKLCAIMEI